MMSRKRRLRNRLKILIFVVFYCFFTAEIGQNLGVFWVKFG